jgi:hypothetical protein
MFDCDLAALCLTHVSLGGVLTASKESSERRGERSKIANIAAASRQHHSGIETPTDGARFEHAQNEPRHSAF